MPFLIGKAIVLVYHFLFSGDITFIYMKWSGEKIKEHPHYQRHFIYILFYAVLSPIPLDAIQPVSNLRHCPCGSQTHGPDFHL